jgi:Tripartite tricarboxylate transporter TctB family
MKTLWGRRHVVYLPSLILWLATMAYLVTAWRYNADARLFPLLIGGVLFVLLPLDILTMADTPLGTRLRALLNPDAAPSSDVENDDQPVRLQIVALAFVFGFAALLIVIGVLAAIPLYVAASVKFLGRRSWWLSLATGAILGLFTYLLFVVALGIDLYPGVLFGNR